jgi:hypothetical protein
VMQHQKIEKENVFLNFNAMFFFQCITNFMGHDLTIIVIQNLFFISLYGINTDVIHLLVLF